jgi:hypothetical protein
MEVNRTRNIHVTKQNTTENIRHLADISNSDLQTASIILAQKDYHKDSNMTKTLGLGLLAGIPVVDSLAAASLAKNGMKSRISAGVKTLGSYGAIFVGASLLFNAINRVVKKSPDTRKEVNKHPVLFISGGILASILIVPKAISYISKAAKKHADKALNRFPKAGEMANSLSKKIDHHISKLDGGRIDRALDTVANTLNKNPKGRSISSLIGIATTAAVGGVVIKHIYDVSKIKGHVKENYENLKSLRDEAKNIQLLKDESNTTVELAEIENAEAKQLKDYEPISNDFEPESVTNDDLNELLEYEIDKLNEKYPNT